MLKILFDEIKDIKTKGISNNNKDLEDKIEVINKEKNEIKEEINLLKEENKKLKELIIKQEQFINERIKEMKKEEKEKVKKKKKKEENNFIKNNIEVELKDDPQYLKLS